MKCPMCGNEIQENAGQCSYCGCKIIYNGITPGQNMPAANEGNLKTGVGNKSFSQLDPMKKALYIALPVIIIGIIIIAVTFSGGSNNDYYEPSYYAGDYEEGDDGVKGWMQDNADGKDYEYDDGGSYYCMGKNDTCPNKTNNAYDLFCSSCDPDGDNAEG